jgi:hypothetical protein
MRSIRALFTSFVLVAASFGLSAQQNDSATPSQQVHSAKQVKKQHSKKQQPAVLQEPNCPYGYYSYAPYNCAPQGFYGSSWFVNGRFTGAGPWYRNLSDIPQTAQAPADPTYPQSGPNYPQSDANYPASAPAAQQQATIEEPNCPYGYYSYAP